MGTVIDGARCHERSQKLKARQVPSRNHLFGLHSRDKPKVHILSRSLKSFTRNITFEVSVPFATRRVDRMAAMATWCKRTAWAVLILSRANANLAIE